MKAKARDLGMLYDELRIPPLLPSPSKLLPPTLFNKKNVRLMLAILALASSRISFSFLYYWYPNIVVSSAVAVWEGMG